MGVEVLQPARCDGCGKFRKDIDVDLFEFIDTDGLGTHDRCLCRWCFSIGFPKEDTDDN